MSTFVKSDGSILVVGRAFILNDTDFAIARYSEPEPVGSSVNFHTRYYNQLDEMFEAIEGVSSRQLEQTNTFIAGPARAYGFPTWYVARLESFKP